MHQHHVKPFKSKCLQLEPASSVLRSSLLENNGICIWLAVVVLFIISSASTPIPIDRLSTIPPSFHLCFMQDESLLLSLRGCLKPTRLLYDSWSLRVDDEVKQLSMEQSAGCRHRSDSCGNAPFKHCVETFDARSDSWTLAASSPMVPMFCPPRVSCAFSSTDCRYLPWASILSCKCRCTCIMQCCFVS